MSLDFFSFFSSVSDRLDGLVVMVSASRAEDPGIESRLRWNFTGSSHTSDSKIGTPVTTLSCAWRYRVSTGTDRPAVSTLWPGEVESWICNFYLSVAAIKLSEQICPWDTLVCCWDDKQPTNKRTSVSILFLPKIFAAFIVASVAAIRLSLL